MKLSELKNLRLLKESKKLLGALCISSLLHIFLFNVAPNGIPLANTLSEAASINKHELYVSLSLPVRHTTADIKYPVQDQAAIGGLLNPLPINENKLVENKPLGLPDKFYSLKEIDHPPQIIKDIETDPPELTHFPQGGRLACRLWLDEKGNVIEVSIIESQLPKEFAEYALNSFRLAKFTPGIKNASPVKTVFKVVVNYQSLAQSYGSLNAQETNH